LLRGAYGRVYQACQALFYQLSYLQNEKEKRREKMIQLQEKMIDTSIEITDGILAQQSIEGNEEAFEKLVQRYSNPLFHYISRFLNDTDTAADILQHVLTQLYLSLPKLHTGEPLKPWLFRVAHNRCLDELRHKRGIPFSEMQLTVDGDELSILEAIPDTSPLPEDIAEQHDVQRILQEAISTLPPKFRAVALLRYTSQLSFAEIAQTLQMPEATAKTYFQRAKPALRAALHDQLSATPLR
jgi:RNA polymerase sigma factor (sigma-70 family)